MMQHELELPNPDQENPLATGLSTFLSFIIFGAIPLLPYIIFGLRENTFTMAIIFTFLALVFLGILRWRVTTQSLIRSVTEVVLIGGLSAVIAYIVGTFFRS
jgi:predicted membrane protein (TIGR00267 family)